MSTMAEQETVVSSNREDGVVRIWTANPYHRARLDAETRARKVREDEDSASYEVDAADWNPLGGFKRRMGEAQKKALRERLAKMKKDEIRGLNG